MTEVKINIDGQWYYRGNRSPQWFALASRSDGSACGIADKVPSEVWPALERVAAEKHCAGHRISGYWKGYPCGAVPTVFSGDKWWCRNHVPLYPTTRSASHKANK